MDRLPRQCKHRISLPILFIKQRIYSSRHRIGILFPPPSILLYQGAEACGRVGEWEGDGNDGECRILVSVSQNQWVEQQYIDTLQETHANGRGCWIYGEYYIWDLAIPSGRGLMLY